MVTCAEQCHPARMPSLRIMFASVTVLATVAALAAPASAATTTSADSHVRATPATPSDVYDLVTAVAGSGDAVVYYVRHQYVPYEPVPDRTGDLIARLKSGRVVDLGSNRTPASLVANTLSAAATLSGSQERVTWWDVSTAKHGTVDLPAGDRYLTGASGGFITLHGSTLEKVSTSGQTTTLAPSPFPPDPQHPLTAVAGDSGLLVIQGTQAAYRANSGSGFTTLDTGGAALRCSSVVGGYAACLYYSATPPYPIVAVLLPLTGAAPMSVDVTSELIANAGSTLYWADGSHLASQTYGSHTKTESSRKLARSTLIAALGGVVAADPTQVKLLRATPAAPHLALLVGAKASPVQATSFSFSPGQLVFNDDRRTSAPQGTSSTFVRAVKGTSSKLRLGATHTIRTGDYPYLAARSGTTTVYIRNPHATQRNETIVVRATHHSTTIHGAYLASDYGASLLSGNRLLYLRQRGTQPPKAYVYDVSTGKTTAEAGACCQLGSYPALSGDYLAYLDAHGSAWRRNLVTGKSTRVSPAVAGVTGDNTVGKVFLSGDYVGWSLTYSNDDDPSATGYSPINAYRDAKTMGAVHSLPHQIYGVYDEGVVEGIVNAGRQVTFSLHTYSDRSITLANGDYVDDADDQTQAPQIQGRDQAWIGHTGVLRAAALPIVSARPRYLGALTRTTSHSGGHKVRHFAAPFSKVVTGCSMTITRGGHTVATTHCSAAAMAMGVAEVAWNGTAHGRSVAAGTYHFAIHVRGVRGRALKANGAVGPITGTIRV